MNAGSPSNWKKRGATLSEEVDCDSVVFVCNVGASRRRRIGDVVVEAVLIFRGTCWPTVSGDCVQLAQPSQFCSHYVG